MFEDDFHVGIDDGTWNFEIQRGGFGTGSFEWTTDDPKNIFTDAEGLHIVPTLTTESTDITLDEMYDNYVVNLTTDGTCTHPRLDIDSCSIRSNKTAGTIINPVRSARINTKGKRTIKYGKVEVVAKMPKGSWLWPAIWMMPDADVYGQWPRSGEIDITESRGNYGDDYTDGRDSVISALHWGPLPEADAFYKTAGKHNVRRTDYSEAFHTYGLEWTEDYLFTYLDSRLLVRRLIPADAYSQRGNRRADMDQHSKSSSSSSTTATRTCGTAGGSARRRSTSQPSSTRGRRRAGPTRRSTRASTSSSTWPSAAPTASSRTASPTSRGSTPATTRPRSSSTPGSCGCRPGRTGPTAA